MPNDYDRTAGAHDVRLVRRGRNARANRRAWRRRSRRAQVAAVATILGLLLVVTFIANYLTTTLPSTMGQNDLQHEVRVQNQVAQLAALIQATAVHNAVSAQVSQPVTLGSEGAPPFAGQDGAAITALPTGMNTSTKANLTSNMSLVFSLVGSAGVVIPFAPVGSAGFVVHLRNTYAPSAEVAYDQGAVVYAQPGGTPIFVTPPRISFTRGVLEVFVPQFANNVNGEAGVGTADLNLRLLSAASLSLPKSQLTFVANSHVSITVVTPYAAAWFGYFQSSPTLSPYVTCTGSNSVCTAAYKSNGPLGTVELEVPTAGITLDFLTALYSVTVA